MYVKIVFHLVLNVLIQQQNVQPVKLDIIRMEINVSSALNQ